MIFESQIQAKQAEYQERVDRMEQERRVAGRESGKKAARSTTDQEWLTGVVRSFAQLLKKAKLQPES